VPGLYDAVVGHDRREQPRHAFRHRMFLWLVDLDALPRLPWWLRPWGGFDPRDHLDGAAGSSLRSVVDTWLAARGVDLSGGRVFMLTCPRVLGYAFNPLSVFWCYDQNGAPVCLIAEVHNTYGERHAYLLHPDDEGRARTPKSFYVSPFLAAGGQYVMRFEPPGERLSVTIALRQEGRTPFNATVRGSRRELSTRTVAAATLRRPFAPQWVIALIHRHGIELWLRRARRFAHSPPIPTHDHE
jgi:hypothetical protein